MSLTHLYNSLKKDVDNQPLSLSQRDDFFKNIKLLDDKGNEIVYVIIKMFEIENNPKTTRDNLPYESKFISKELRFDLDKIPDKLKHILNKFLNIHIKNMEEEKKINEERFTVMNNSS